MISFYNVSKTYAPKTIALQNASFKIKEKEFVSIAGRSGAGKTTLLKLLVGEEKPTKGQVFFSGHDIAKIKTKDLPLLRQGMGIIFQDYKLLPSKTVFENLVYVMEVMGESKKQILQDVPQVLDIVDLTDRAHNFPVQLSGGEIQRAAIARAIIHRPDIILADEPTGNLDPYHARDVIQILLKINEMEERGATVLLATHNKDIINSLNKRVITLEDGKIIRDEENGRFLF